VYIYVNDIIGAPPVSLGRVKIEVSSAVPGADALVRVWPLALSAATASVEETLFLTPL